jgi:kinesin family protein 6/9
MQYNELKDLKSEIERIQDLLERCREKMQRDFEQWLQVMIRQKQLENQGGQSNGLGASP